MPEAGTRYLVSVLRHRTVKGVLVTGRAGHSRIRPLGAESGRHFIRGGLLLGHGPGLTTARLLLLLLMLLLLLELKALLQLQQLSHEVQVWRYDWTGRLDHFVRIHHGQLSVAHDVRYGHGRRPRYTGLTVNQHASAGLPCTF